MNEEDARARRLEEKRRDEQKRRDAEQYEAWRRQKAEERTRRANRPAENEATRRPVESRSAQIQRRREEHLRDALALADLKKKVSDYEKEMQARIDGQPDDDPAFLEAWRFRVVDLAQVPLEFQGAVIRPVDEEAVRALVAAGVREILGIEIALKKMYIFRRKQPDWDHS